MFIVVSAAKREHGPFWILCDSTAPVEIVELPFAPKEFWKYEQTLEVEWANKRPFATAMGGGRVAKCAPPLSWYRNPQFRVKRAGVAEKEEANKGAAKAARDAMEDMLAIADSVPGTQTSPGVVLTPPQAAVSRNAGVSAGSSGRVESAGSSNKSRRRSSMAAPPPQKLPTVTAKRDSETQVNILLEIFSECDRSGDGYVSKIELIKACRMTEGVSEFFGLPQHIRQEDGSRDLMEELFQDMDVDDDRNVSWDEFFSFYSSCKGDLSEEEDEVNGPSGALLIAILLPDEAGQSLAAVHIVENNSDAPDVNEEGENMISENPGHHTVVASSGKAGAEYSAASEIGAVCELIDDMEDEILIIPSLLTRKMEGKYRLVIKSTEAITVDRVA